MGHFASTQRSTAQDADASDAIDRGVPFLGICVGMQWMFDGSQESQHRVDSGLSRRMRTLSRHREIAARGMEPARSGLAFAAVPRVPPTSYVYFTHSFRRLWVTRRSPVPSTAGNSLQPWSASNCSACNSIRKSRAKPGSRCFTTFARSDMLTKRIIACLDVNGGRVVKGVQFDKLRDAGDPAELARHSASGADEIVLLDIFGDARESGNAARHGAPSGEAIFIPFTVGGGIRTLAMRPRYSRGCGQDQHQFRGTSRSGLISGIAERFGSQAVVVAIDAKREPWHWEAFTRRRARDSGRDAVEWAREAEMRGAGEILLTSMDRDGTGSGFDCDLTRAVADTVRIPVIASGGAGGAQHFVEVFRDGHADAALAASIFHYGFSRLADLKKKLRAGNSGEVAMLIPSIDLMGGKIVQLVQGRKKALEFDDFDAWVNRFSKFPLVQLIDLDAAIGTGTTSSWFEIAQRVPCQVGGGIRTVEAAGAALESGAKRVILGSALFDDGN